MRVIAGEFRSRKLNTLAGDNTRPTQDKIKESMFSAIGNIVSEAKVLDLFAGSGSVGLESLSRGAKEVFFCDMSRDAIRIIESNIKMLKVETKCHVRKMSYELMLKQQKGDIFDFIFIDPPYENKIIEECLVFIEDNEMLSEYGVVIVETHKDDVFKEGYGCLYKWKEKKYGITRLTYYKKGITV